MHRSGPPLLTDDDDHDIDEHGGGPGFSQALVQARHEKERMEELQMQLEQEYDEVIADNEMKQKRISDLEKRLRDTERLASTRQEEIHDLQGMYKDLQQLKLEKTEIEQRLRMSEEERHQMEQDLLSKDKEVELQSERLKLQQQLKDLQTRQDEAQSSYDAKATALADRQSGDSIVGAEVVASLQSELQQLRDLLDERTAEIDRLNTQDHKHGGSGVFGDDGENEEGMTLADELDTFAKEQKELEQQAREKLEEEARLRAEAEQRLEALTRAQEKQQREREALEAQMKSMQEEAHRAQREREEMEQRMHAIQQAKDKAGQADVQGAQRVRKGEGNGAGMQAGQQARAVKAAPATSQQSTQRRTSSTSQKAPGPQGSANQQARQKASDERRQSSGRRGRADGDSRSCGGEGADLQLLKEVFPHLPVLVIAEELRRSNGNTDQAANRLATWEPSRRQQEPTLRARTASQTPPSTAAAAASVSAARRGTTPPSGTRNASHSSSVRSRGAPTSLELRRQELLKRKKQQQGQQQGTPQRGAGATTDGRRRSGRAYSRTPTKAAVHATTPAFPPLSTPVTEKERPSTSSSSVRDALQTPPLQRQTPYPPPYTPPDLPPAYMPPEYAGTDGLGLLSTNVASYPLTAPGPARGGYGAALRFEREMSAAAGLTITLPSQERCFKVRLVQNNCASVLGLGRKFGPECVLKSSPNYITLVSAARYATLVEWPLSLVNQLGASENVLMVAGWLRQLSCPGALEMEVLGEAAENVFVIVRHNLHEYQSRMDAVVARELQRGEMAGRNPHISTSLLAQLRLDEEFNGLLARETRTGFEELRNADDTTYRQLVEKMSEKSKKEMWKKRGSKLKRLLSGRKKGVRPAWQLQEPQ